jgi:hypothetical protein
MYNYSSARWHQAAAEMIRFTHDARIVVHARSEETSVKVHCVSNATRIIPRPKICHWNIPRSNMSQDVTGSFKEYSWTNAPAFMHLINLTASLLHKDARKA